eukprot:Lithocolla_globosa_v1_NODE_3362_length_1690_cov_5.666055.p1 type:complete len:265 gc:universal NODE_3362_length_1690_cov_5.666055:98-892(+)
MLVVRLVFAVLFAVAKGRVSHHDDNVVRVWNPSQGLRQTFMDNFDIWDIDQHHVDLRVTRENRAVFDKLATPFEVLVEGATLQEQVEEERRQLALRSSNYDEWFDNYHTYEEMRVWYRDLCSAANCTFEELGVSHQGRAVFGLRFGARGQPRVYYQGLQHAREWISGAVVAYLTHHLLTEYTGDLLERMEFLVVPILNPDGYHYTWNTDRMWRKNRRDNADLGYPSVYGELFFLFSLSFFLFSLFFLIEKFLEVISIFLLQVWI